MKVTEININTKKLTNNTQRSRQSLKLLANLNLSQLPMVIKAPRIRCAIAYNQDKLLLLLEHYI